MSYAVHHDLSGDPITVSSEAACLAWNDPAVGIVWPLRQHGIAQPMLSAKDQVGKALHEV